jgi:hypothetical protein
MVPRVGKLPLCEICIPAFPCDKCGPAKGVTVDRPHAGRLSSAPLSMRASQSGSLRGFAALASDGSRLFPTETLVPLFGRLALHGVFARNRLRYAERK